MLGCPICLMRLEDPEFETNNNPRFGVLTCGHFGHFSCLSESLRVHAPQKICPSCKAENVRLSRVFISELNDDEPVEAFSSDERARLLFDLQKKEKTISDLNNSLKLERDRRTAIIEKHASLLVKYDNVNRKASNLKGVNVELQSLKKTNKHLLKEVESLGKVRKLLDENVSDPDFTDFPVSADSFEMIIKASGIIKGEFGKQVKMLEQMRRHVAAQEKVNRELKRKLSKLEDKSDVDYIQPYTIQKLTSKVAFVAKGKYDTEIGELSLFNRPKWTRSRASMRMVEDMDEDVEKKENNTPLKLDTPGPKVKCCLPKSRTMVRETSLDVLAHAAGTKGRKAPKLN